MATIDINPNPFIANSPGTLSYSNPDIIPVNNNNYQLINVLGIPVSNTYLGQTSSKTVGNISGSWTSICSSSDGVNLAACINGGGIYTSPDSGVTWTITSAPSPSPSCWSSICSDSTGQYLAATARNDSTNTGNIYTSSNSGLNWTLTLAPSAYYVQICSDSTGQQLAACASNQGFYMGYISINRGLTWAPFNGPPGGPWLSICSDSTGQYLTAGYNAGIWTSQDLVWSDKNIVLNWKSICSSSSGQYLAACIGGGGIYTSSDYGDIWVQKTSGLPSSAAWTSICSNSTGQNLAACIYGGGIYYSLNYGATWTISSAPTGNWSSICSNSTSSVVAACVDGGHIYVYNNLAYQDFKFTNVILPAGDNILSIFNLTTSSTVATNIEVNINTICFKEGTKILCLIDKKEQYIPIEKITENMFVKTYKNGYKKAKFVIKSSIINSEKHTICKLYKLAKKDNPKLIEDLYVTGSHALLHDSLTEVEHETMNKIHEGLNYPLMIHDKYKLIAYYDDKFEEINDTFEANIYHIILESVDKSVNYGIYANGILAESTDYITLERAEGFQQINNIQYKLREKPFNDINLKIENYLKNKNKKLIENEDEKEEKEKEKEDIILNFIVKQKTWKKHIKINHNKTYKK